MFSAKILELKGARGKYEVTAISRPGGYEVDRLGSIMPKS